MSAVMLMTSAFDIGVIAPNAVQYIQKVFLTNDGSNSWVTGIILDGSTNGGITINNLTGKVVLWTDANGKLVGKTSGDIYNLIAWLLVGWAWTTWATWATGTSIVSGYVINGILYLQYSWANGAWTWTVGSVQGNPWAAGATWATGGFTSFSCAAWEIIKFNGTSRWCSGDLQWWVWGTTYNNTYYTNSITGMNFNSGNNILTLYVSGSNAVTGFIILSGMNNWNSWYVAYTWMITSWTSLWNRYNTTWINITSIARLSCTSGQVAKATSTGWNCAADLQWAGWASLRSTWALSGIYYNIWNVGVATTTPFWQFQVWDGLSSISMWSAPMWGSFAYIYNYVWFNAARNSIGQWRINGDGWSNGSSVIMSNAWGSMYFANIASTGGANKTLDDTGVYNNIKMILQSNGNLGIGTITPQSKLEVNGNIRISNGWYIWASSNVNQIYLWLNGNVGVWVWSPVARLEVNGGVKIWLSASSCDAAHYGEIKYDGNCFRWCNPDGWISLHACEAPQCGTSNGQAYASLTVGNCSWSASVGGFTPHPINNDGTAYWTRTCADIGQTVSCASNKIQPGNCGTCETVLCDTGTLTNRARDSWHPERLTRDCIGTYGWTTTACIDISGCSTWWL